MARHFAKGFKRSALTVALVGLCFAGGVSAQSSVGSIFGHATANDKITIQSADSGLSREVAADSEGRFTFSQLPPGRYTVTSQAGTREVAVKVGTGTSVNFVDSSGAATTLDTVTVVGTGAINPIDVSSVESTSVFTAEQIQKLPVQRDITNVALLAPGTVKGDTGFGNLASFGGSSVAENGYYINGFDVTNIRTFLSYASLPFESIAEQQVKTGGYGAEYGRSLGGVISLVTKRGTNEWKFGGSLYWSPDALRSDGKDVLTNDPDPGADKYFQYRSADESEDASLNLYAGGPIIKDKLFFFGLVEGRYETTDTFFRDTSSYVKDTQPRGMVKLDWNITDDHLLEFTGISNRSKDKGVGYNNPGDAEFTGEHGERASDYTIRSGGEVYIGKYTGYLTDTFTVSALYGYLSNTDNYRTPEAWPGAECPRVFDSRPNPSQTIYRGCWDQTQPVSTRTPGFGPNEDKRRAYRIDAEWQLGDHRLRFGYDHEKFSSAAAGATFIGGGRYFRYFNSTTRPRYGLPDNTDYVRVWDSVTGSGTFEVENTAIYLEDSWQATDNLVLYGGLRLETFENFNAAGQTFIEADDLLAPRVGFSWDVNGDSTFKVFGNAGRYYIPVASNSNIRATRPEYFAETFYLFNGIDPTTYAPISLGTVLEGPLVNGSLSPPDSRTIAATNLDPMYQDEFILGAQWDMGNNWSMGLRAIKREVKSGMDDYCTHNAFNNWAADNGFNPEFALDGEGIDMASCFFVNPGQDVELALDPDNDGTLSVFTVPASYLGLPEYSRKYSALEVFWEKSSDKWSLQGSYTWAKVRGNVEGYVNSTLEQDDPGLTQDFDHAVFEDGSFGYVPTDRRHTFKLFGSYQITDEWRVGGNLLIQSGRPVNCNGFAPINALVPDDPDHGTLAAYSASTFYCVDPNGNVVDDQETADPSDDIRYSLGNRGDRGRTPWIRTIDASVAYTPRWLDSKLTLQMDIYNLLNSGTVTEYSETSETSRGVADPNFLNHVNYLSPRSVRFTVRYDF